SIQQSTSTPQHQFYKQNISFSQLGTNSNKGISTSKILGILGIISILTISGSVLSTTYCMPDEKKNDFGVEVKVGANSTGAEVRVGVDVASVKVGAVETQLRPNVDTGATVGTDGVEVKAAGFGFSVGKKTGISTPLGELAVDADDCVIQ
ncbi:14552_t:CDS:2, partial [Cetraspora pellucida]